MSMKLDDKALDEIANLIKAYCQKQKDAILNYCSNVRQLENSWNGGSFEELLSDIEKITDETEEAMTGFDERFYSYYQKKAEMIRCRPVFSGGTASVGRSVSSAGATRSSGAKTIIDTAFQKCNDEIMNTLSLCLQKINFCKPNEKISFYDPDGKSKRGLHKNIMAIDINSPSFEQDLRSLTGQHIFFQTKHEERMQLIKCLGEELENKTFLNEESYSELAKQIQSGGGIEAKYLTFSDNDEKTAFVFFAKAFQATFSNSRDEMEKYKKYFSDSYACFSEILQHLIAFK